MRPDLCKLMIRSDVITFAALVESLIWPKPREVSGNALKCIIHMVSNRTVNKKSPCEKRHRERVTQTIQAIGDSQSVDICNIVQWIMEWDVCKSHGNQRYNRFILIHELSRLMNFPLLALDRDIFAAYRCENFLRKLRLNNTHNQLWIHENIEATTTAESLCVVGKGNKSSFSPVTRDR